MSLGDDRTIDSSDNPLHGRFRHSDADASLPEARARRMAWWALGCAVVWLFGFGSLLGLVLSIGSLVGLAGTEHGRHRILANIALAISLLGLVAMGVAMASVS